MPETTAITSAEVFQFMKTASDEITTQTNFIIALIAEQQAALENRLGRKLQKTTFSSVYLQDGVNCKINPNNRSILILKGIYRDIYTLTSIYEDGILLTESTAYDDDKDYFFDKDTGILIRQNGSWSIDNLSFKITGTLGLCISSTNETTKPDLKYALIEMVAASSGLWIDFYNADGVRVEKIQDRISKKAEEIIKRYEGVRI